MGGHLNFQFISEQKTKLTTFWGVYTTFIVNLLVISI